MHFPESLLHLIQLLRKLPGVGNKTAERYAFQMLDWDRKQLEQLGKAVTTLHDSVTRCEECGALIEKQPCPFCPPRRESSNTLCIVASPKDLFAMEETGQYRGFYHVLEGLLSPLQDKGPEVLRLNKLLERVQHLDIKEVIIALDSTLEGDATSLYLQEQLASLQVPVSRLAFGLPMGSPLEYVDGGTLARALLGRSRLG